MRKSFKLEDLDCANCAAKMQDAISKMLGGGTEMMLGDLIEQQFLGGAYNPQLGAAISLVMMLIVVVCMVVMNRFGEGEEQAVML